MKAIAAPLALLILSAGPGALAQEVPAAFVGKWQADPGRA